MISTKARWSSARGQTTSRNPDFALFALIFLIFFLILYHLNRKRTIHQLNWIEGVAYGNSTIFSAKFKPPSWLWVRCIGSWIWASSHWQTWLVRHNISQRQKQHNTISMKAQRTSPRGQATIRNPNFTPFAPIFWYFSDSVSIKETHQFSSQFDKRCGL
jgi:hypothetical protein